MSPERWFPTALLLVILAATAPPILGAGEPVILFPPDMTLSLESGVKIFAFAPGAETPLPVSVNGIAQEPLKGESFQNGEATLNTGMNILNVGGKRVKIYHLPDVKMEEFRLSGGNEGAPLVFRSYRLHPALDDGCEGCHLLEEGELKAKDQKEACYACHDNFEKKEEGGKERSVHTPVKAGECTGCHDPHFSTLPKLQKLEKGCLECHDPFTSEGTVHYPVEKKECNPCHSPHAGPGPSQVVLAGNALCFKCHKDFHTQHRSAQINKPAMTQIPPDVPRDKENISCIACHLPHQSDNRRLFRKSQGELCKSCHLM
ncbi:MAG: cytochrome c3 family protein [Deltaproteobacteria bacterium]|nr:cytochrome c3 family protein [Deltaproteobacteria bacterium]